MYGDVNKIKLGKTLFPNWRHILVLKQIIIFTVKAIPIHGTGVGIIVVHVFIGFC